MNVSVWPYATAYERPLLADSVEKVGSPKWPEYWPVKTPFYTLLREI